MAYSILEQVENHEGPLRAPTLAKIFGVHRTTIYEMMADGRIPVVDAGFDSKIVDPATLAYVLRKRNPLMKDAARHKTPSPQEMK